MRAGAGSRESRKRSSCQRQLFPRAGRREGGGLAPSAESGARVARQVQTHTG